MKEIGILLALLVCFWAIMKLGRRRGDDSRSARLMKKYKILTPELLADTPDYELVEAVVAHVLAEAAESRQPDVLYTLSRKPQPYLVVYSVWAVCKELARGDYKALTHTATRHVVQDACDGLPLIGAPATAEALTNLVALHKEGEDTAAAEQIFHNAVETECPLSLCVTYIRDHIAELMGEEPIEEIVPAIEESTDGE